MPDPQWKDWFSQFEDNPKEDYFSQFEEIPKAPEPPQPEPLSSRAWNTVTGLATYAREELDKSPNLKRFLFGPSEEDLGGRKLNAPTTAPGEIPGLRSAAGYVRNKLVNSGDYATGYLGGLINEFVPGLAEGAFDPGQAAIKTPIPGPQRLLGERNIFVNPGGEASVGNMGAVSQGPSLRESLRTRQNLKDIVNPPEIHPEILAEIQSEGGVLGGGGEYPGPKTRYEINSTDEGLEVVDVFNDKTLFKTQDPREAEAFIEKIQPSKLPNLKDITINKAGERKIQTSNYIDAVKNEGYKGSFDDFIESHIPKFSKAFNEENLFKGSEGTGLDKNASFENQWKQAIREAERLGIDYKSYDNLDELQWDITRKAAIATKETGKNPLADIPQFARSEKGGIQIGADVKSLGKILGSSLYKGDIAPIATKELLQNAVDATRHLGPASNIEVTLKTEGYNTTRYKQLLEQEKEGKPLASWDTEFFERMKKNPPKEGENYVEVRDNGKGMTRQELETVFTDLGASGKRNDASAVGGFGVAKAAPLLGGKKVDVTSTVLENGRYLQHSFSGTPDELLEGVSIKTKQIPTLGGQVPQTGTVIRTYTPTGSGYNKAKSFVNDLAQHSTGLQGNVRVNEIEGEYSPHVQEYTAGQLGGKQFNLSNPSADVDLIIPKDAEYGDQVGVNVKVLNNGMFQNEMHYGGYQTLPNVPDKVVVNVRSKVPEGHPDYPFTMNREELRGSVHDTLSKYINENIIRPGLEAKSRYTKEAYNNLQNIPGVVEPIHFYDVGGRFTPDEALSIYTSPLTAQMGDALSSITREVVDITNPDLQNRLEKIGYIFDSGTKGIWIPNPGTDNAAILISPYEVIYNQGKGQLNPYQAAGGIHHTIMHEVNHFAVGPHDEKFTYALSKLYEALGEGGFDAELQQKRRIYDILTGGTGDYLPEVQEILSTYTDSRGRKATVDDPLYRTGIKSADSEPRGKRNVSGNIKPPTPGAIGKLIDALAEHRAQGAVQEAIRSQERAQRFGAFEAAKGKGREGFYKALGQLKGEYSATSATPLKMSKRDIDSLFTDISYNSRITTPEKARAGIAMGKLLMGDVLQRNELALFDRIYGPGTAQQILELHGGLGIVGKSGIELAKIANTMKSMKATIDLSAPFRQGMGQLLRKEYWNAFYKMFGYGKSQQAFEGAMKALEDRPNFLLGREAGLFLADHSLGNFEEQFMNSYINDVRNLGEFGKKKQLEFRQMTGDTRPLSPSDIKFHERVGKAGRFVSEPMAASERAYVGFLNQLRADTFDSIVGNLEKAGYKTYDMVKGQRVPTDLTRAVAKHVNITTGRGGLGKLEKIAEELNVALFSPKLISSRLTMMNPMYYVNLPKPLRMEALRSLMSFATAIGTIGAVGAVLGGETKLTPTLKNLVNPDFGKVKFGKTRVDPGGGLLQYIVAATQFISGQATSSTSQRTYPLGGGFGQTSRLGKVVGIGNQIPSFMENKLSPMFGMANNLLSGRTDPSGKPMTFSTELRKQFTPLFIQDMMDLYKEDPNLLGLGIPASLGMGVQTYQERDPSSLSGIKPIAPIR